MKSFLFKEHMLNAVVAGTKTQTRRLKGLEKINENPDEWELVPFHESIPASASVFVFRNRETGQMITVKAAYKAGEVCYLKENYCFADAEKKAVIWQTDWPEEKRKGRKWKSKLMMKATDARYFVKVKEIKCERLLNISEEDVIAEGIEVLDKTAQNRLYKLYNKINEGNYTITATISFYTLFESINGKEICAKNPWLFAYVFEMVPNPFY